MIDCTAIALTASDGYVLAAKRYVDTAVEIKARLVMAGATGVPQAFYRRFAEYAATQGFDVMTLDYRGIGESAPESLVGFDMDYRDWARYDLAAAVAEHHGESLPLFVVGHSYGGHAIGLLPNHHLISAVYTFATGAGWHGWMPFLERWKAWFMWTVLGPVLTRKLQYLPGRRLGLGEDMPLAVFTQWRRWCMYPNYFFGDPQLSELEQQFAQVTLPMVAANATDDWWALPRSRNAFMTYYRNAPMIGLDINPRQLGLKSIGHMGYFRPQAQALWQPALDWLWQHATPVAHHTDHDVDEQPLL